ncbi:MAG: glutathione S-transferase family protein [Myxococcota bacterium]
MGVRTLYGMSGSRAFRSVWAIEEVGIEYTHVATNFGADSKAPDYLAVNPNGRIPALVDGDLVLFESMAINLYLAERYGAGLYPDAAEDRARTHQWSVWGISEIEPLQMQIIVQTYFTPEEKRNPKVIENAKKGLERPLAVLDAHLADRDHLLGGDFTIADLNLASVLDLLVTMTDHDLAGHAHVKRWTETCYARPSYAAAKARD